MASKFNKLAGKQILIIGGTSGIGFAVAEACIDSGACVTVSSSQQSNIDKTLTRIRTTYPDASLHGIACDLSKPSVEDDLAALFEAATKSSPINKTGKLDHVIFTAGDALATLPLSSATLPAMHAAGQIRFYAQLLTAKIASRYLNPGPEASYTMTTGSVADHPIPDWSVVASFAAGLKGMCRNLALDLRPLRVNLVAPGPVDTELWKMGKEEKEGMMAGMAKSMLTGRVPGPEDVAQTYLWLMRDHNVTGFMAESNGGVGLLPAH